jgi:hypothetical protein
MTAGQASAGVWTGFAWIAGFALSTSEAFTPFYAAAAGVIATLLLTLAIQAAWFRVERPP